MNNEQLRELIGNKTGMDTSVIKGPKALKQLAKTLQKTGILDADLEFPKAERGPVEIVEFTPKGQKETFTYVSVPSIPFPTPEGKERSAGRVFVPMQVVDQLVSDLLVGKEIFES